MRCPNCSEEIPSGAKFCPYCGNQFQISLQELEISHSEQLKKPSKLVSGSTGPQIRTPINNDVYPPPQDIKKKKKGKQNALPVFIIVFSSLVILISLFVILRSGALKVGFGNKRPGSGDTYDAEAKTSSTSSAAVQAVENIEDTITETVAPTEELVPTDTPVPTATPTHLPTATPLPTPTQAVYIPEVITIYDGIQATASDFLFPESSREYLTTARMNEVLESSDPNMMHKLSQLAINELLARYGFTFTSSSQTAQDARDQFANKGWYQSAQRVCPSNQWDVLRANYFNSYERANFDALNQWQKDHGVYY